MIVFRNFSVKFIDHLPMLTMGSLINEKFKYK